MYSFFTKTADSAGVTDTTELDLQPHYSHRQNCYRHQEQHHHKQSTYLKFNSLKKGYEKHSCAFSFSPRLEIQQGLIRKFPKSFVTYKNFLICKTMDACSSRSVLTTKRMESLYYCLYDSFENNKEKALSLLLHAPPHLLGKCCFFKSHCVFEIVLLRIRKIFSIGGSNIRLLPDIRLVR